MGAVCAKDPMLCCEEQGAVASRQIDSMLEQDQSKKILKVLLLGPGESGKSTTLKQFRILHAEGYTHDELKAKRHIIYINVIDGLIAAIHELHEGLIPPCIRQKDAEILMAFMERLRAQDSFVDLPDWVADAMMRLNSIDAIQRLIQTTADTIVGEAARYFLDHLERIRAPDYLPSLQDVLKCRVSTLGCIQMTFHIKDFTFKVFDVGGQRSQRKKWLHIFDDVHTILFITSLSEYNQTLAEDSTVNRMRESLSLFGAICHNEFFIDTAIILFLNKIDLFEEKIKHVPINVVFPRYRVCEALMHIAVSGFVATGKWPEITRKMEGARSRNVAYGTQSMEESLAHITKRFLRENTNKTRTFYVHRTCATDTAQIEIVINSVVDVIIQKSMQKMGIQ